MNVGRLREILKHCAPNDEVFVLDQASNLLEWRSVDIEHPDDEGDVCVNIQVNTAEE